MKAASLSDFELLDNWRQGDNRAGNELFERYFGQLYRFFGNKVNQNVDDLIQDTFLACVQGKDRFRKESSFRSYLFAVAKNILYREFTRRSRALEKLDFTVTHLEDLGPTPTNLLARHGEQQLLIKALRHIPLEYQITLELYYWEELSGPELADILEIPEPAVRSRIRRGLEMLRARMAELATSPQVLESTCGDLERWAGSLKECFLLPKLSSREA